MRTNIDIDDTLMEAAMKAGGFATKRETVEAALRMLAQRKKGYADALALAGIGWEGDLDAWRRDKQRPTVDARVATQAKEPRARYPLKPTPAAVKKRAAR